LTGIPLHFCDRPDSWPWDVEIVDLSALHRTINLSQVSLEETLRLLVDLADESLKAKLAGNENLPPVVMLTDKEAKLRSTFAQRIAELLSLERLNCCGHSKANVQLSGRPLLLGPGHEGELLFGDDPIAWIRNGLHAIDARTLSSLDSWGIGIGSLLPCPTLRIELRETEGHRITSPTIPALYIGLRPVNQVIDEWRATFWLRDIQEGYALAGEQLQAHWRGRVPGTSELDPVYRFIREPSERLRDEALLFLRQAHETLKKQTGAGDSGRQHKATESSTASSASNHQKNEPKGKKKRRWYYDQDENLPPEFKCGPLPGHKKEFAQVCIERELDHRTFEKACLEGYFGVQKLKRSESEYPFGVWFKTEDDLKDAKLRLAELRKAKAAPDTVEGNSADDSTEPISD
jgi:hypothetical protein